MKRVVVRYTTKPERADENQALIEAVFAELDETDPGGVRYAAFRLGDGVSFVHIAEIEGDENPLGSTAAFAEFQREIGDRCEQPPLALDATVVGSYRLLAD